MDDRIRKRQLEAAKWGVERHPNDILVENIQSGRWVVLFPATAGSAYSLLQTLGGRYLGYVEHYATFEDGREDGGVCWHVGFEDEERTRLAAAVGTLWNTRVYGGEVEIHLKNRFALLGLQPDEIIRLEPSGLWLVEAISEKARESLPGLLVRDAYYWKRFNSNTVRRRNAANIFRNGDIAHQSCLDTISRMPGFLESKWSGRGAEQIRYRWPKSRACGICGGKTIRPKVK